jgi:hypothetical protein
MKKPHWFLALSVLWACFVSGCVSVPEEAATLSAVVGERLAVHQSANEALLHMYFDSMRERIERFMRERWIPEFTARFFRQANLVTLLESPKPFPEDRLDRLLVEIEKSEALKNQAEEVVATVERAWGDAWRSEQMFLFTEAALTEIENQRRALMNPIDNLEKGSLEALQTSYAQLIEIQATVTAYLRASHKASIQQDLLLQRVGLLDERDQILTEAAAASEKIVELTDQTKSAEEIITDINDFLRTDFN